VKKKEKTLYFSLRLQRRKPAKLRTSCIFMIGSRLRDEKKRIIEEEGEAQRPEEQ
jgi:hypothetical protein